jgi:hypothetical protein
MATSCKDRITAEKRGSNVGAEMSSTSISSSLSSSRVRETR